MAKSAGVQDVAGDEVSNLLKDFTNFEGDTDNGSDDEEEEVDVSKSSDPVDEDVINKELVTWAGRLELESIDLRQKAKELTSQMTKNSLSIKNTSDELKSEFIEWKESSTKLLDGSIKSFSKATSNFLSATKSMSNTKSNSANQTDKRVISSIFEILESTQSSIKSFEKKLIAVNKNERSKTRVGGTQIDNEVPLSTLNKKLQTIINSVQRFQDQNMREEELRKESNSNILQLNETLGKCLRRIEDIQYLQVDFGHELKVLNRSQNNLLGEFNKIKSASVINNAKSTNNQINKELNNTNNNQYRPTPPNSSFNESSNIIHQPRVQLPESPKNIEPRKRGRKPGTKLVRGKLQDPNSSTDIPLKTHRTRRNLTLAEPGFMSDKLPKPYQSKKRKILQDRINQTKSPRPQLQRDHLPQQQREDSHYHQFNRQQSQPIFSSSSFDKHDSSNNCISLLSDDMQSSLNSEL
ncbi:hypothetical protein BN7_2214 [Wickerhamomyces ciferrii]|uniref:Uncharacterized protein n=1 Tax=Wickerhamomyces ciferrii (strain ATCC 14091 / BCRC 22168 / CBS 111 / JCM 3599 / NBRC 0793 / NRRL Y-1031 F-60-10) TaxID=1206466 RepID=K0KC66_WICCF|nr:uncharacterized protein BN7_2214 [Wickerhamomyces ciferrii]CCH42670.1 hypothetical protein BN7_2214 [Wickerhamomyces ciferrii]